MESNVSNVCQCQCVPRLSTGEIPVPLTSFRTRLKLILKRNLSDHTKRRLKKYTNNLFQAAGSSDKNNPSLKLDANLESQNYVAGDLVRVRSEEAIQATLNTWNELKGCMFMDAQRAYCNTTQRVLKTVERFVDERDYRVKKAKGLVLLEGVLCEGTPEYGRCDRACYYFWREEWLEKIV